LTSRMPPTAPSRRRRPGPLDTRRPDAFISAMEKLGRLNLSDPAPPALVKAVLHSHPPIAERIAMAQLFRDRMADPRP
jgi:Zn-dependent protease with chaperone function